MARFRIFRRNRGVDGCQSRWSSVFCGIMCIEGACDGLLSRMANDVIICIVGYWELFQVVRCADCVVTWTNFNFVCVLVLNREDGNMSGGIMSVVTM